MSERPEGWSNRRDGYGYGSGNAEPEGARPMPHVQRQGDDGNPGGWPRMAEPPRSQRRPVPPRQPGPQGYPSQGYRAPSSQDYPAQGYDDRYGRGGYADGPDRGGYHGQSGYPDDDYANDGYNAGQVYGHGAQNPAGGPGGAGPGGSIPRRKNWKKRITITLASVLVVLLGVGVGTYFWADSKLQRNVDLSKVENRPPVGKGTNYLIVGSDSRAGMSKQQQQDLHTGYASGGRTDSMIILHVGSNGDTMLSLPRDSYLTIPAFTGPDTGKRYGASKNKLNASYSWGGPDLLVRTIEYNTGLHIDHYAEIGFDGFANLVDALGGVNIDVPYPMHEKHAGTDLNPGEQTLDGQQALAFVRQRYDLPGGDLDREKHQQQFLSALAHKVLQPSTVLNPFKLYPSISAGLGSVTVDKDMSLWDLKTLFFAMKSVQNGDGKSMDMPVADAGYASPQGSAVLWDMPKVKTLMDELKNDQQVTVTGSS
jgi:LCP family protein required for cell wall assembly